MAAMVNLPVYVSIGGGTPVEVAVLEIAADGEGAFTVTRTGIADMLRAAADAYDAEPEGEPDDAEGVPDAERT